ncbi:hypothetical protein Tco_0494260, partial [Tanacetum coccineum]
LTFVVGVVGSVEDGLFVVGGVSCCLELSVGEEELLTLEVPALKNSSYKGPKRRSNSCCDGTVVSAEGENFVVGRRGQKDDSSSDITLDDIYDTFYKEPKVTKEPEVSKEPKVAKEIEVTKKEEVSKQVDFFKEVIAISSCDDEVSSDEELTKVIVISSSDDEVSSDEELTSDICLEC